AARAGPASENRERNIMDALQWQRPSEVNTDAADVVEIADTAEGVLLRTSASDTAVLIDRGAWVDFSAAVNAGEYDAILPSAGTQRGSSTWTPDGDMNDFTGCEHLPFES